MKINLVKPLLLCATSSLLLGCGSGSSSDDPTTQTDLNLDDATTVISDAQKAGSGFSISEENYVATVSAFYNTAVTTAATTAVANELMLSRIRFIHQASTSRACSISGETVTETVKHPLSESIIHSGDSIKSIKRDCKDAFANQSGTQKVEIDQLEGTYESYEYVISADAYKDITQKERHNASDNGVYRYHLPIVYGLTDNENIKLIGINLSLLDAGVAPNINFPDATATEVEHAKANELKANPSYFSTPAAAFNTFAFEAISNDSTTQTKTRWKFDITNKEDANASYSMQTTRQLILEDRYVDESDDEDGDNLETVALEGKFNFKMATGEIITVEIFSPDAESTPGTPIPSNVVVYFDNYGDGVIDAQTGMTWEEFTIAMFGFFAL